MRGNSVHETRSRRRLAPPLSLRLALRELRGGVPGFYVFAACVALGVAVIAAIGALTVALQDSLRREGRVLLGGDVEASLLHRRITSPELAFLADKGKLSEAATLRAMARTVDGSAQALINIKAVDGAYPLYGSLDLQGADGAVRQSLREAVGGAGKAAVAPELLAQLGVRIGDRIRIGSADFTIAASIVHEPDNLSGGLGLGARVLISLKSLETTGLVTPGSLVVWRYRLKTPDSGPLARTANPAAAVKSGLKERFPEGGFRIRGRNDPSPGISRAIGRLGSFLSLAGLAALLVGGVGAANAVTAFIEKKRRTIAAYKALGASGGLILRVFLLQTMLLAALGVTVGLVIGAVAPVLAAQWHSTLLPFRFTVGVYPGQLALAAAEGMLVSLAFILWPLGRAQTIRAGELLREPLSDRRRAPPWRFAAASAACMAGLAASAVLQSQDRWIAFVTCMAMGGVFALFWALGWAVKLAARAAPRPAWPEAALALSAIGGPGGSAAMLMVSLGTGLTMLVTVALVNSSLTAELESDLPKSAPSHFFRGVPKGEYERFASIVTEAAPGARLERAPELRGRFVSLGGEPVETLKPPKGFEWVVNGDRGLTFFAAPPRGSLIMEGKWWPEDYRGPPLVSFDEKIGRALGLKLGDVIVVNVLGRNVAATIANFRAVKWKTLGINFIMIFSPDALKAAPYGYLAALNWPDAGGGAGGERAKAEGAVTRAVASAFPNVTVIQVREALETVHGVIAKIMAAIRAAGMLTLVMGGFVMAGALTAAGRQRIYQAVILKTVGAPPRRILTSHVLEHLGLALATTAAASVLGGAAAYGIVTETMEARFTLSAAALLQAALLGTIFAFIVSAYDSRRALQAKAAPYLRAES
jgi:putative ABC transport system permease protein